MGERRWLLPGHSHHHQEAVEGHPPFACYSNGAGWPLHFMRAPTADCVKDGVRCTNRQGRSEFKILIFSFLVGDDPLADTAL